MVAESDIFSLSLADIVSSAGKKGEGRPFKLVGLRQFTAEPLVPYLVVGGRNIELEIDVVWGGFDTMVQDALDPAVPLEAADAVLICPSAERFAPEVFVNRPREGGKQQEAVDAVAARLAELLSAVRVRTNSPVLFLGWPESSHSVSLAVKANFGGMINMLDLAIQRVVNEFQAVWPVNTAGVAAWIGEKSFFDPLRFHRVAIPYSETGIRHVAAEILIYLRNLNGKVKKVLALDCDHTLWGGLCGEVDNVAALDLGPTGFPDAAHLDIQRWALDLRNRGVLLALVSKNEEDNVWRVFDSHESMVLSKSDIAAWRINWTPKAQNIKELADELNVGLDSFVFVDDQPIEVDAVREFCPEVTSLQLDEKSLLNLASIARRAGWFETLSVTETDLQRTDFFTAERNRKAVRSEAVDFDSYLRNLEMVATLKFDGAVDFARAEQMCARTNQMNLTTKRHLLADIEAFAESPGSAVVTIGIEDRLGDLGDVGLGIMRFDEASRSAHVDSMLLSCRAFSRKCEELIFEALLLEAEKIGASSLQATYIPTKKNKPAMDLLEKTGFKVEVQEDGGKVGIMHVGSNPFDQSNVFREIKTIR